MPFEPEQYSHVIGHKCTEELRFLLDAIDNSLSDSELLTTRKQITDINPLRLFELARLNKLLNVLPDYKNGLPEGCAALNGRIGQARLISAAMNRQSLKAAGEISRRLSQAGIRHVHLKGPLQQIGLYGTDHYKPSADIDILVLPHDRKAATRAIVAAGYTPKDAQTALWWTMYLHERHFDSSDRKTMVDLHHGLHQPGIPPLRNLSSFLEAAQTQHYMGVDFPVPGPLHRALLAALSVVKAFLGHEPALGNVVDLRTALAKLSPDERQNLVPLADSVHLTRALMLGIRFVEAVFPMHRFPEPDAAPALPDIAPDTLRTMITTPWVDGLPWPRRHEILLDLCAHKVPLYLRENIQSVLAETLRKCLEMRAPPEGKAR